MVRVLIADPDPNSRRALALLLTHKLSVDEVREVHDMDSFKHNLSDFQPGALLLADDLPGLDLPEACSWLREAHPGLPIALLSVDEAAREKACACQIMFIHKGAILENTLDQLKELIEGAR
jgi:DNA-binding NarL/FixJ family response regulator